MVEAEAVVAGDRASGPGGRTPCARARAGCRRGRRRRRCGQQLGDRAAVEQPALDRRRAAATARSPGSSRSIRAARSAWIVGGTASSAASGSSASIASICSTKSGFPSAVSTIRSRSGARRRRRRRSSPSTRLSARRRRAASSETSVARGRGAAHDGRASKRSGRARQRSRIGAPLEKPSDVLEQVEQRRLGPVDVVDDDDERPRRRRASRTGGGTPTPSPPASPARLAAPTAPAISRAATSPRSTSARSSRERRLGIVAGDLAHDLGEREVGDPLAVRDAAADEDARLAARASAMSSRARRDLPIPGGPTIVASAHDDSRTAASNARAELVELRAAADERRRDRAREGRHVRTQAEQPPGRERPRSCPSPRPRAAGSTTTASRTSSYVASPSSTSPGAAACSSRAATFTASPVASFWSAAASDRRSPRRC